MPGLTNPLKTRRLVALSASLAIALSASVSLAQRGYDSDPVEDSSSLRRAGSIVKNWVKRPNNNPAEVQQFDEYFDKYYFPSMTLAAPESLGEIGKLRGDLFRQYLDPAAPEVQKKITEKAYSFATRVIRGLGPDGKRKRYHRAVQYNAVLILGGLTIDGEKPLPAANKFLCQVSAFASQGRFPGFMQAGALVGLSQHAAKIDALPQDAQNLTMNTLATATKAESVSTAGDPPVQDWLRRRAAISLAEASKKTNQTDKVAPLLIAMLEDEALTLDTRVQIAASLDGMSLPEASGAAAAVLTLADLVGQDETKEAEKFEDIRLGNTSSRGLSEGEESLRYRFDQQEARLEYVQEGLAARLTDLKTALNAVKAAAGASASKVDSAIAAVDSAQVKATTEDALALDITEEIRRMASVLSTASATEQEVDAEADEPSEPEIPADAFGP